MKRNLLILITALTYVANLSAHVLKFESFLDYDPELSSPYSDYGEKYKPPHFLSLNLKKVFAFIKSGELVGNTHVEAPFKDAFQPIEGIPINVISAISHLREASKTGHPKAVFGFKTINDVNKYLKFESIASLEKYSEKLYNRNPDKATRYKNPSKLCALGFIYQNGIKVPIDKTESLKWFTHAADQGNVLAQFVLGWKYYSGEGVVKDHATAIKWLRASAEKDFAPAQCHLGWMLFNSESDFVNEVEAIKWYQAASEQGYPLAKCNLAYRVYFGSGTQKDIPRAVELFKGASKQNCNFGKHNLGICILSGLAPDQTNSDAFYWIQQASDKGLMHSQYLLGLMNYSDYFEKQNRTKAFHLLNKSAQQGFTLAQYSLACMFNIGEGILFDPLEAEKWFKRAAQKDFEYAQYNLGWIQIKRKLKRDDLYSGQLGVENLRKASQKGLALAAFSLGWLYDTGTLVPEQNKRASVWYAKAAEADCLEAQYNLGNAYLLGEVNQTVETENAIKWHLRAAESGNAESQLKLGKIHQANQINDNTIKAYSWYNLSSMQGNQEALMAKTKISLIMSLEQIAEAQKLSGEWYETIKRDDLDSLAYLGIHEIPH